MNKFAEILFPQAMWGNKETLTYSVPENLPVKIGTIVEVSLRKKNLKGIIFALHDKKPPYPTKEIQQIHEYAPHLSAWQVELIKWIGDYYFCPLQRVLKLFLPAGIVKKKTLKPWGGIGISEESGKKFKHELNNEQKDALGKILTTEKKTILLHGITGSGKTEVYLNYADEILKKGQQVLMMIPEISLTPQTLERFHAHFKGRIAIIHSQLTPKEKEQEWLSIYKNEAKIIIGSRSALFAPFQNLGAIIIDEEHESSYKQDNAPRHHTVDTAIQIAKMLNIKVILGSATPSLENYYKTIEGEFELIELIHRANREDGSALPKTYIVDLRIELKKKNFSIFSELLSKKILEKLNIKEQGILFLNRRGAASAVICRACGYIVKCENCELSMTYHKKLSIEDGIFNAERLICHHCSKIMPIPAHCPNCESPYIRYIGIGTQKVEEELKKDFPLARVIRADRDTVQKKDQFKNIYQSFKKHEADFLVGTQMIALGLHLPKVNLVGIILADMALTIPSFRSSERTFQLITQVAGRAGRTSSNGEVIIQTYLPNHYAIKHAAAHDYKSFYQTEIAFRKELQYPPFSKLIKLTICHKNIKRCHERTSGVLEHLKGLDPKKENQITSYPALIPRLNKIYRWHILINGKEPAKILQKTLELLKENDKHEMIKIDVDPLSTI